MSESTGPGTDPDYAPAAEIFDGLSHGEIHAGVSLLDPAAIDLGRQAWQTAATGLADVVAQAHTEIRALIADGWRGGAAAVAVEAVRGFERDGQGLADVMSTVARRLGQAGDAAEALRAAVGAPSGAEPDLAAALLDPTRATANSATQKSAEHDRQDVVAAMDAIYTGAFLPAGSGVPAFPEAVVGAPVSAPATADVAAPLLGVAPREAGGPGVEAPSHGAPVTRPEDPATGATTEAVATEPVAPSVIPAGTASAPVVTSGDDVPRTVAAGVTEAPAPVTTAPTTPDRVAPAAAPAAGAPAAAVGAPVVAANSRGADESERKREDSRRENTDQAVTSAGAGAFGGMLGGALAADSTRPGSGIGAPQPARPRPEDEEDDDLHWSDDDLTFLEPADEPVELIGELDPTTPPVVGEWTEFE